MNKRKVPIKIGLPKGFLKEKSFKLLKKNLSSNKINRNFLHFHNDRNIHFYLLKVRDIPELISKGALDVGITLSEWLFESGLDLDVVKELDWYTGRISLLSKNPVLSKKSRIKINCATEYPKIANDFFKKNGIKNFQIHQIYGSSEGLVPSLFNCSIDCVETGKTIKAHKLNEESIILNTTTILVKGKNNNAEINQAIQGFIKCL